MPLLSEKFIYISQSGETADSRAVLVETNKLGHKSLTITNVAGSTLSREADHTLLYMLDLRLQSHLQKHIQRKLLFYLSYLKLLLKIMVVKPMLIY